MTLQHRRHSSPLTTNSPLSDFPTTSLTAPINSAEFDTFLSSMNLVPASSSQIPHAGPSAWASDLSGSTWALPPLHPPPSSQEPPSPQAPLSIAINPGDALAMGTASSADGATGQPSGSVSIGLAEASSSSLATVAIPPTRRISSRKRAQVDFRPRLVAGGKRSPKEKKKHGWDIVDVGSDEEDEDPLDAIHKRKRRKGTN
ncbi:hypothetical protein CC1G_11262 [Coprinopsis cinerea okayama7|uniref:Uncharacterized protein n=1 Tax=Coprinopsis cinerea (strain Okayama-7 / 130 / ATCC MYA-4618 / FGSC 9003) TaxID=240176 RepID=A8PDK2_COPC7|nr:hypothetical protein CC1G_11262 [Coprinopsis cinerea okayama7\|eukprot:XP_001840614.2 hypothetical protein CC1G_11262 [Coprinopsis cinerea okayama7\